MSEELKPCPFCGDPHPTFTGYEDRVFIMCGNCGADVDSINCDGEDVRKVWNRRAPAPSPWVSVEERLPEDGADVAFIVTGSDEFAGRMLGGRYRAGKFARFAIPGVSGLQASHWMPLPPAPAKEDGHE